MNRFSSHLSTRVAILLSTVCGVSALQAHPGHDLASQGVAHALTSPYHLATMALVGAGMLACGSLVTKAPVRRGLQVAGVACLTLTVLLGLRA